MSLVLNWVRHKEAVSPYPVLYLKKIYFCAIKVEGLFVLFMGRQIFIFGLLKNVISTLLINLVMRKVWIACSTVLSPVVLLWSGDQICLRWTFHLKCFSISFSLSEFFSTNLQLAKLFLKVYQDTENLPFTSLDDLFQWFIFSTI